ncbi:MAG TPA: TonB-dependent receptor [Bacteroidota bacterium]|nr:TonB-dependent receptor [Bacteroidota bacterium]
MPTHIPVRPTLAAMLLATASLLFAGTTGILEGTIVDRDSRETLIGVTVSIVGTTLGAATDAEGFFQINNIESGTYDVRITNIGYQPVLYKGVMIRPDLRTRISIEMVQSAVELEAVEITAERPLIQKDVTSTTFSISSKQVDRLPVKNVADLLALFPSVTAEGNVRGGKSSEVVYLVDGLPMQDVVGGGIGGSLPKSAITEFSVQSGGFDAEYGNALSGVVNIITRRGGSNHSAIARVEKDNWFAGGWNSQNNRATETELTLSGPLLAGKLSYFGAATYQANDTRWWQDFDNFFGKRIFRDLSGIAKLDYAVASGIRVTAQNVFSLRSWRDYEFSWRFALGGLPSRSRRSYRSTATLSHTLTDNLHYTLNLTYYYLRSRIGEGGKSDLDLTPYELDFFLTYVMKGSRAWWADTKQRIYTAKTDLVYQPNANNVLKVGFEFNQYDIFSDVVKYEPQRNYFGKVLVDSPQLNYSTMYNYYPRTGSLYLQEKLEVQRDGAVVNLGFRWDFLDARSQRPNVEYTQPDTGSDGYESKVTGYTRASLKQQISPRMGLSFPMMWNLVLIMNYGHYFQFPLFDYLYSGINPQQLAAGVNVLVGNPDLKPERTHAWEIGMKYGLDERTLVSLTYFKKEFIDQIDSKTFLPSKARAAGDYGFAEYINNAFANAEGVEVVLSRTRDDILTGSLSYSLMRTEGVSEYVDQGINYQQWGFAVVNQPYPLSWDQLHSLKLNADLKLPYDLSVNLLWNFATGKPYTYFPSKDGFTPEDSTMAFLPNNARLPSTSSVSVKFSKQISLGWGKGLTLYGDISNVFNAKNARWADANGRIGGQLADPSAYYELRRFSLGVKYEI